VASAHTNYNLIKTTGELMSSKRKNQIITLLKGIETGDPKSVLVVNPEKYIQHNPQTHEGGEGLAALFKRLSKTRPRVNIVRSFSDGDFVFAHTEYDFSTRRIGFEVFRFEGDQTVEHWDNIQDRQGPNTDGHSMVDGAIEVIDLDKTESNRKLVQSFIKEIMINGELTKLNQYIEDGNYTEHNPNRGDDLTTLRGTLSEKTEHGEDKIHYKNSHRFLAEGNFVLSVNEGFYEGIHSSFYDLFRLDNDKIVEHWNTTEKIAPKSEWKNNNGKF